MRNNLLKTLIPLALLPMFVFAQPAAARGLFWWENVDPNAPGDAGPPYQQAYGAPEYQDLYGDRQDQFDERQYQLYQREMHRRYGYRSELPPDDGTDAPASIYNAPPRYAAPSYVAPTYVAPSPHKHRKIVKATPLAPKAPDVAMTDKQVSPATPKNLTTTVGCDKGAAIVSGFGFENVKTKSCEAGTLAYNAERSGQPFEVSVNPKTGELIAVKKLAAPAAPTVPPETTPNTRRTEL